MEWRIIVPVLCLIGILHVPGNAAQSNSTNSTTSFQFNVVFHISDSFKAAYSNMSNNDTISLKNNITSQVTAVYNHLKNFERFDILQFRNGSIVVDGKLHFNNSDSKPDVANLTQILHNGNFTFTILKNSTNITEFTAPAVPSTTSATTTNQTASTNQTTTPTATATTPAKTASLNVVFRITQTFKDIYSNLSHPETKQLTDNITTGFSPFYKKRFANFLRMLIRKYSQGSIVTDSVLEFDNTNNTSPNLTEVKNVFTEAIANGNFSFTVDPTSINVTDITTSNGTNVTPAATTSSGSSVAANNYPVLASMLPAFWMTLTSLLLSAVVH